MINGNELDPGNTGAQGTPEYDMTDRPGAAGVGAAQHDSDAHAEYGMTDLPGNAGLGATQHDSDAHAEYDM